jgi:hypothetical protein
MSLIKGGQDSALVVVLAVAFLEGADHLVGVLIVRPTRVPPHPGHGLQADIWPAPEYLAEPQRLILPLLEQELNAGQHTPIKQPLASRSVRQDGGSLRLIKVKRRCQPGGLFSTAIPQGREIALVPGQSIQCRQQCRLAGIVRPGDQDHAGPRQVHLGLAEGPEIFQPQSANTHPQHHGSRSHGCRRDMRDDNGSPLGNATWLSKGLTGLSAVTRTAFGITDDGNCIVGRHSSEQPNMDGQRPD